MEIPYSMARRLPPCHCPEEDRDIVQPLRPYLPLMLSLRDPVFHGEKTPTMPLPRGGPGYCSATSTLSPSHAESEEANSLARRLPSRMRSVETSKLRVNCSIYRGDIRRNIWKSRIPW